jgi:hypothetical protein
MTHQDGRPDRVGGGFAGSEEQIHRCGRPAVAGPGPPAAQAAARRVGDGLGARPVRVVHPAPGRQDPAAAMAAAPPKRRPDALPGVAPGDIQRPAKHARPGASGGATGTTIVAGMCASKHSIQAFKHGREIFFMMLGT